MVMLTIFSGTFGEKFNQNNFDFYALDLRKYNGHYWLINIPIIARILENIMKKLQ
jgi:hypothetical protein